MQFYLKSFFILLISMSITQYSFAKEHIVRTFDSNTDGEVTRQEFEIGSKEKFTRMDSNKDDTVNLEEFGTYMDKRYKEFTKYKLGSMDIDKNDLISKEEYINAKHAKAIRRFNQLDRNSDDQLSEEELSYPNAHHKKKPHDKNKHPKNHIFNKMDTNNDGIVTQQENEESWNRWFSKLDTDGDNKVTTHELEKMQIRDCKHK